MTSGMNLFRCQWRVTGEGTGNAQKTHNGFITFDIGYQTKLILGHAVYVNTPTPLEKARNYVLNDKGQNKINRILPSGETVVLFLQHSGTGRREITIRMNGLKPKDLVTVREILKSINNGSSKPRENPMFKKSDPSFTQGSFTAEKEALLDQVVPKLNKQKSSPQSADHKSPSAFLESGVKKAESVREQSTSNFYGSNQRTSRKSLMMDSENVKRPGLVDPHPEQRKYRGLAEFAGTGAASGERKALGNMSNKMVGTGTASTASTWKPTHEQRIGLPNLGSTCYLNAFLQAIALLPSFTEDLMQLARRYRKERRKTDSGKLFSKLAVFCCERLDGFSREKKNWKELKKFQALVVTNLMHAISKKEFKTPGLQQDAHELLCAVFDQMNDEVIALNKRLLGTDATADATTAGVTNGDHDAVLKEEFLNPPQLNFQMQMETSYTCKQCGHVSTSTDMLTHLSAPCTKQTTKLQACVDQYFDTAVADNYKCEKCSQSDAGQFTKKQRLLKCPRVLIVHLKRYQVNIAGACQKVGSRVDIPKYLTLRSHCNPQTEPPPSDSLRTLYRREPRTEHMMELDMEDNDTSPKTSPKTSPIPSPKTSPKISPKGFMATSQTTTSQSSSNVGFREGKKPLQFPGQIVIPGARPTSESRPTTSPPPAPRTSPNSQWSQWSKALGIDGSEEGRGEPPSATSTPTHSYKFKRVDLTSKSTSPKPSLAIADNDDEDEETKEAMERSIREAEEKEAQRWEEQAEMDRVLEESKNDPVDDPFLQQFMGISREEDDEDLRRAIEASKRELVGNGDHDNGVFDPEYEQQLLQFVIDKSLKETRGSSGDAGAETTGSPDQPVAASSQVDTVPLDIFPLSQGFDYAHFGDVSPRKSRSPEAEGVVPTINGGKAEQPPVKKVKLTPVKGVRERLEQVDGVWDTASDRSSDHSGHSSATDITCNTDKTVDSGEGCCNNCDAGSCDCELPMRKKLKLDCDLSSSLSSDCDEQQQQSRICDIDPAQLDGCDDDFEALAQLDGHVDAENQPGVIKKAGQKIKQFFTRKRHKSDGEVLKEKSKQKPLGERNVYDIPSGSTEDEEDPIPSRTREWRPQQQHKVHWTSSSDTDNDPVLPADFKAPMAKTYSKCSSLSSITERNAWNKIIQVDRKQKKNKDKGLSSARTASPDPAEEELDEEDPLLSRKDSLPKLCEESPLLSSTRLSDSPTPPDDTDTGRPWSRRLSQERTLSLNTTDLTAVIAGGKGDPDIDPDDPCTEGVVRRGLEKDFVEDLTMQDTELWSKDEDTTEVEAPEEEITQIKRKTNIRRGSEQSASRCWPPAREEVAKTAEASSPESSESGKVETKLGKIALEDNSSLSDAGMASDKENVSPVPSLLESSPGRVEDVSGSGDSGRSRSRSRGAESPKKKVSYFGELNVDIGIDVTADTSTGNAKKSLNFDNGDFPSCDPNTIDLTDTNYNADMNFKPTPTPTLEVNPTPIPIPEVVSIPHPLTTDEELAQLEQARLASMKTYNHEEEKHTAEQLAEYYATTPELFEDIEEGETPADAESATATAALGGAHTGEGDDGAEQEWCYRLMSVISHIGNSPLSGHYMADVYDMKRKNWFNCDDANVTRRSEQSVLSSNKSTGYIFIYMSKCLFDELGENENLLR